MLCTVVVVVIICKNIVVVLLTSTACATWQQLGRSGALTCTTHALLSSICVEVSWSRCLATVALLVARQPEALLQHFASFFFFAKGTLHAGVSWRLLEAHAHEHSAFFGYFKRISATHYSQLQQLHCSNSAHGRKMLHESQSVVQHSSVYEYILADWP